MAFDGATTGQSWAAGRVGTALAVLGAAAMTFAGLMKIFNTEFRGDMAENYEVFGAELPARFFVLVGLAELVIAVLIVYRPTRILGAAALTTFMVGALILNLGFAKDVLAEGVSDQSNAWPANLVLAALGASIGFFARDAAVATDSAGRSRRSGLRR